MVSFEAVGNGAIVAWLQVLQRNRAAMLLLNVSFSIEARQQQVFPGSSLVVAWSSCWGWVTVLVLL
jgi:hypothetical protein